MKSKKILKYLLLTFALCIIVNGCKVINNKKHKEEFKVLTLQKDTVDLLNKKLQIIALYSVGVSCHDCYSKIRDLIDSINSKNELKIKVFCLIPYSNNVIVNRSHSNQYKELIAQDTTFFDICKDNFEGINLKKNYDKSFWTLASKYNIEYSPSIFLINDGNLVYIPYEQIFNSRYSNFQELKNNIISFFK